MSEREQSIFQRISKFPPALREKFLDKAEGAAMALDAMGVGETQKEAGDAGDAQA